MAICVACQPQLYFVLQRRSVQDDILDPFGNLHNVNAIGHSSTDASVMATYTHLAAFQKIMVVKVVENFYNQLY